MATEAEKTFKEKCPYCKAVNTFHVQELKPNTVEILVCFNCDQTMNGL